MAEKVEYWKLKDGRIFPSREEAEAAEADEVNMARAALFAQSAFPAVGEREKVRIRNVVVDFLRWEKAEDQGRAGPPV